MSVIVIALLVCAATSMDAVNIVSRKDWGGEDPKIPPEPLIVLPPTYVVIHHSATVGCTSKSRCVSLVKSIQNFHMNTNLWNDIGYNFLIGEDGNIYEGRGWGIRGAHAPAMNRKSIGICILGTFTDTLPAAKALKAVIDLITYGIVTKNISPYYKLIGHRQVSNTECPGSTLYKEIMTWPRWTPNTRM